MYAEYTISEREADMRESLFGKENKRALRVRRGQYSLELSAKTSQKPQNLNTFFGAKKGQVLGKEKGQHGCWREHEGGEPCGCSGRNNHLEFLAV